MNILEIILMPILSICVLFVLAKLNGYRQVSQMSMFDYINGITIGSIAAEISIAGFDDFTRPLIAMIIFGIFALLISVATNKSICFRRMITGEPIILMQRGKIYDKNFSRGHLDIMDFLIQCRNQGYFDISRIDTALLEPNGNISILPLSTDRPATPSDLNIGVSQEEVPACVIIDGKIMENNLKNAGFDTNWLKKQMENLHQKDISKIFLGTCTSDGILTLHKKGGQMIRDTLS